MVYVASRTGLHHEICEDAVLVGTEVLSNVTETLPLPETGFVCIADGVGGSGGGADASRAVLEALRAETEGVEDIHTHLVQINQRLIDTAKEFPETANMATTLTGFSVREGVFKLIHVGNTRAYIRQGHYLKQITSDHTTYNWLKSSGQAEAAESCNKNEITNCFGGANPMLLSKLVILELPRFSLMVLTSDGIHEYIDLDTFENILNCEGNYADKCEAILDTAWKNGSEDDMTIVVIVPEE